MGNLILNSFFICNLINDMDKLINENLENNINEIVGKITSFLMDDKFLYCSPQCFLFIILKYENSEKFLFIKILFLVLEKLKDLHFEKQLNKYFQLSKDKKERDIFEKNMFEKYQNVIQFDESNQKKMEEISEILKKKEDLIDSYYNVFSSSLEIIFEIEEFNKKNEIDKFKEFIIHFLSSIKNEDKKQILFLIDYFTNLDYLNHTKDLNQLLLLCLNLINSDENIIKHYLDKNGNEFEKVVFNKNISENYNWFLFEESSHYIDKNFKYSVSLFQGKKFEKKDYSINFYNITYKTGNNNNIEGIICKSFFTNKEIIMIKLNLDKHKEIKISLNELKNLINNEIKTIKQLNNHYNELKSYIILNNKIITIQDSYEKTLKDLIDPKILKEDEPNNNNKIKKIVEK